MSESPFVLIQFGTPDFDRRVKKFIMDFQAGRHGRASADRKFALLIYQYPGRYIAHATEEDHGYFYEYMKTRFYRSLLKYKIKPVPFERFFHRLMKNHWKNFLRFRRRGERPPSVYLYRETGEEKQLWQSLAHEEEKPRGRDSKTLVSFILRSVKKIFPLDYTLFLLRHYYFIRDRDHELIRKAHNLKEEELLRFLREMKNYIERKSRRKTMFLKSLSNQKRGRLAANPMGRLEEASRVHFGAPQQKISELTGIARGTIARRLRTIEKSLGERLEF